MRSGCKKSANEKEKMLMQWDRKSQGKGQSQEELLGLAKEFLFSSAGYGEALRDFKQECNTLIFVIEKMTLLQHGQ